MSEEIIFDKQVFRDMKAEKRRIDCRIGHVETELEGARRKTNGLRDKLKAAEAMLKEKEATLGDELEKLNGQSKELEAKIETL